MENNARLLVEDFMQQAINKMNTREVSPWDQHIIEGLNDMLRYFKPILKVTSQSNKELLELIDNNILEFPSIISLDKFIVESKINCDRTLRYKNFIEFLKCNYFGKSQMDLGTYLIDQRGCDFIENITTNERLPDIDFN